VKLSPLSGTDAGVDDLREAVRDHSHLCEMYLDETRDVHTVFELPQSFDDYLALLNRKQRGGYRRAIKDLTADHDLKTDVMEDEDGLIEAFPEFEKLHAAQWSAEGKLGHFQDWPGSSAYHEALLKVLGAKHRAHLLRMSCDGETVSYQLCYSMGDVLHWVLPARSLRGELERHSLGRLGLIGLIEFAIGAGFRRIEGGLGHYDYKLQLGAKELPARTIVIAANGVAQRPRIALLNLLSKALDLLYYRVWFQRIAPKLPFRRRPLWHFWIRTRL
jgi:CelD/BcsL family acetyltransferase involved in cellulose biosynthesis